MAKRVYIIHGWEGRPDINWFGWLKGELEQKDFIVEAPFMPDTNHPTAEKWIAHLNEIIKNPDADTFFVGHSLGVVAILRYLETLSIDQHIGGAVLVAGFPEPIGKPELLSFFSAPLDYARIKNTTKHFIAIHSDNDPYVPLKNGEVLRDSLGAQLIIVPHAGHLNQENGFTELPIVLESVLKIATEM